jgi:hypothetical protein
VDGVTDLYATEAVARRLIARLGLEDDPAGRLALHVVALDELPRLSDREELFLAWCDLADRADPAADVALEALWPGTVMVARLADLGTSARSVPYTALRGVVDWTARHPRLAGRAITDPPARTGDPGVDSLLAAIAETIADDHGLERPDWTADVDAAPLVVSGMVDRQSSRWDEVPSAFAARDLGFPRETFWRQR